MQEKFKKHFLRGLAILFFANIFVWLIVYDLENQDLEVNFFDIGQGDGIFIETPNSYQILIDGGPDSTLLEKLGKEMPFWDRTIDLVVLTHPEHDHIAGLIEVLKRYEVDFVLWTGILRDTGEYREWKNLLEANDLTVKIAQVGQRITTPKIFIDVLYPLESLYGQKVKNTNDSSVILRLVYNNNSFLFTGDSGKSIERKLVKNGLITDTDVLKVGHHGSKTSTSKELLEALTPQIAVVSAGKENRYGHPCQEVLDILGKYAITILRTDQSGDIKIISDGNTLKAFTTF